VRPGVVHFHRARSDTSNFLRKSSSCIKAKPLADENGWKMMIWFVILGRERRNQSLVLMVRIVGRKNRATSRTRLFSETRELSTPME
jgi:hypothetical protein